MSEERETRDKQVQPEHERGLGSEIVAGVVGGIASGAAGAAVQQGLAKLNTGKSDEKGDGKK